MSDRERLHLGRQKRPPSRRPPVEGGAVTRAIAWNKRRRAAKKKRLAKLSRPKRVLRRVGVAGTWLLALITVALVALVALFYSLSNVPRPSSLPLAQTAYIYYSDGSLLAKIGTENRTTVPLDRVPEQVRYDVIAAEDRGFYSEPGVSIKGTLRAAISDLTGGDTQGGSGITQQYVKNAYLSDSRTLSRKLKELMIAVKLSRQYTKDQILEFYLNTVYFGRGAYGIQAAARTYFGENVHDLTVSQGAVLAALLRAPSYYDPAVNPGEAKSRWQYVIDGMVSIGRLTQAQANALTYPPVKPPKDDSQLGASGPEALIVQRVVAELEANGIDGSEINYRGLRIYTTIDKHAQHDAERAIKQAYAHPSAKQKNIKQALVAVDPSSGGVLAYYGGSDGTGLDYAQAWRQPGSSFKPYVLATALDRTLAGKKPAYTIDSVFDGSSPQKVDGFEIHNDPTDPSSGHYSLSQAMTLSLNTVFYKLASLVGPANVADLAHAAGIPLKQTGSGPDPGALTLQDPDGHVGDKIGIGGYEVRPIDQAVGYATLADGGVEHDAYFVQRVVDASGNRIYQHKDRGTKAIDPKVVNDTTISMEKVASTSQIALADNRPSAAKTGTVGIADSPNSSDAWTVGFTPQVAVASWAGSNTLAPIYDDAGNSMYGRENPGTAWQLFMNAYLANQPVKALPTKQEVGVGTSTSTSTARSTSGASAGSTSSAPATNTPPPVTAPATTTAPPSSTAPSTPPLLPTPPVTAPPGTAPASGAPSSTCTPGLLHTCP